MSDLFDDELSLADEPDNINWLTGAEVVELIGCSDISVLSTLCRAGNGPPRYDRPAGVYRGAIRWFYQEHEVLAWRAGRMQKQSGHKGGRRFRSEVRDFDQAVYDIVEAQQPMTVRQVYYRTVVKNLVPKTKAGYDKVQQALRRMRMAQIADDMGKDVGDEILRMSLDWIIDGSRPAYARELFSDPAAAIDQWLRQYHRDFWQDRDEWVVFWLEKDALSQIVAGVAREYDCPVFVARGCNSISFAYDVAEQIKERGLPTTIYYLRDLDPTGITAPAALEELFEGLIPDGPEVTIVEVALTPAQITQHGLEGTAQETKKKDNTHYPAFETKYGTDFRRRGWIDGKGSPASFELDALPPATLRQLVRDCLGNHVAADEHEEALAAETADRQELQNLVRRMRGAG